jgi:hypothetical protein
MILGISRQSNDTSVSELVRSMAGASERQLLRIVAAVDGMSARGAADELIAPVRHRLANLRPVRPLRFARLVFLPLDHLIVPAANWKPHRDCTHGPGHRGRLGRRDGGNQTRHA